MDALSRENEEKPQERLRVEAKDKKNILINRIVAIVIFSIALLLGFWGLWKYKSTTNKMEAELIEKESKREAKRKAVDLVDKAKVSEQSGRYEEALGFYKEAKSLSPDIADIDGLIADIEEKIEEERRRLAKAKSEEEERRKKTMVLIDKANVSKQSGRYEEALDYYAEVKALSPDFPNIDTLIEDTKRMKDEEERRKKTMVLIDKANMSKQSGRYEEALGFYKEAKSLSPDIADINKLIAEVEMKIEKGEERKSAETSEADKISNISNLIIGQWKDEDSINKYFKDGTFVTNAYTGEKYRGTWSVINNTLRLQFLTPKPVLNEYTIIELTDTKLKTRLNGHDGRVYNSIRVKPTLNSYSLFASRNSRIYHKSICQKLNTTEDLIEFTSSLKAQEAGGIPCKYCNPSAFDRENATDDRRDRRRNPFDAFFDRFFPQVPPK